MPKKHAHRQGRLRIEKPKKPKKDSSESVPPKKPVLAPTEKPKLDKSFFLLDPKCSSIPHGPSQHQEPVKETVADNKAHNPTSVTKSRLDSQQMEMTVLQRSQVQNDTSVVDQLREENAKYKLSLIQFQQESEAQQKQRDKEKASLLDTQKEKETILEQQRKMIDHLEQTLEKSSEDFEVLKEQLATEKDAQQHQTNLLIELKEEEISNLSFSLESAERTVSIQALELENQVHLEAENVNMISTLKASLTTEEEKLEETREKCKQLNDVQKQDKELIHLLQTKLKLKEKELQEQCLQAKNEQEKLQFEITQCFASKQNNVFKTQLSINMSESEEDPPTTKSLFRRFINFLMKGWQKIKKFFTDIIRR